MTPPELLIGDVEQEILNKTVTSLVSLISIVLDMQEQSPIATAFRDTPITPLLRYVKIYGKKSSGGDDMVSHVSAVKHNGNYRITTINIYDVPVDVTTVVHPLYVSTVVHPPYDLVEDRIFVLQHELLHVLLGHFRDYAITFPEMFTDEYKKITLAVITALEHTQLYYVHALIQPNITSYFLELPHALVRQGVTSSTLRDKAGSVDSMLSFLWDNFPKIWEESVDTLAALEKFPPTQGSNDHITTVNEEEFTDTVGSQLVMYSAPPKDSKSSTIDERLDEDYITEQLNIQSLKGLNLHIKGVLGSCISLFTPESKWKRGLGIKAQAYNGLYKKVIASPIPNIILDVSSSMQRKGSTGTLTAETIVERLLDQFDVYTLTTFNAHVLIHNKPCKGGKGRTRRLLKDAYGGLTDMEVITPYITPNTIVITDAQCTYPNKLFSAVAVLVLNNPEAEGKNFKHINL